MVEDAMIGGRLGDFEILERIADGGMGRVYKARSLTLDRIVAVKVLSKHLSRDPSFVRRFLKEARAAARLNHPGIVQIYDFGEADSTSYLVMEYVDGHAMAHLLRQQKQIPEKDVIDIGRQACLALGVAHAAGLVHRDVKPDNLMLTRDGRLKLIDLGIAKVIDEDLSMTQTGMTMGTPLYIAPEQIRGQRDIDCRADIYSLGASLFHLATGHPPFVAANGMEVMARHLSDPAPDPRVHMPDLSEGFCRVIGRMLAKAPGDRYPSMMSVERDLELLVAAPSAGSPRAEGITLPDAARAAGSSRGEPPAPGVLADSTPGDTRTPVGWDSAVLLGVEEHLAAVIGPLAKVLVRRTARETTSLESLCSRLAEQIPSVVDRDAFLRNCLTQLQAPSPPRTPPHGVAVTPTGTPASASAPPSGSAGGEPARGALWGEADLRTIEEALTAHIGPLAKILVKKAAKNASSLDAMAALLAEQIDDQGKREQFRSAIRKLR